MAGGLVVGLLLGVSVLVGGVDKPVPTPKVYVMNEAQLEQISGMTGVRGLYDPKTGKLYLLDMDGQPQHLTAEELTTLAHELVHATQDAKGDFKKMDEAKDKNRVAYCERWFDSEMQALDIENGFRSVLGLPPADRFAYYVMKQACISQDGM